MSESNDTGEKKVSLGATKPLRLRRTVESGTVRQNFSHGRTKSVVVEKKRKRTIPPKDGIAAGKSKPAPASAGAPGAAAPARPAGPATPEAAAPLTEDQRDARARALAEAKLHEVEDSKRAREETERQARELAEARARAEKAKQQDDPAARDAPARDVAGADPAAVVADHEPGPAATPRANRPDTAARAKKSKTERDKRPSPGRRGRSGRQRGKLTIANALDDAPRQHSLAALRRKREREKQQQSQSTEMPGKVSREVILPDAITIQELSNRMAERSVDVVKFLMKQGQMLKINEFVDTDTAQLIAEEFGHTVKRVSESDVEEGLLGDDDDERDLVPRPPVVTIMGHVDHGKTSLLDALREANVAAGEAGGITQHIGAYQVSVHGDKVITFLDTPGHEAFSEMRARGANVTDIVILVVAADDGVMPQTIEAISHAREAKVPIVVAINKMDKTGADASRVRNELLQHEIVPESMGGDVLEVEVSATERTNLDKLLDAVLLQAEILEIRANPDRAAEGVVVEAKVDRGRGTVATVLVQRGTLKLGDIVVAGAEWGKVRALVDSHGENIVQAGPSVPVEILGLGGAPAAGNVFSVVDDEARAREVVEYRIRKLRHAVTGGPMRGSLEQMMTDLKSARISEFPILVKADVQGSVEAIVGALRKLGTEEVAARVVHSAVGGISESDVTLATASNAVILGFNVRANRQAREAAAASGVEIRYYNVIYNLVDDVKAAMSGLLSPEIRETFLGNAEVLEVFNVSKIGKVAGCKVTEGRVERGANVRLVRDDTVIHEGELSTLKRFKDEVKEVSAGQECGMGFENYQDLKPGDIIECFRVQEIARSL